MEPLYRSPSWPRPNHELKFIDTDEEDVPCKAGEVHFSDSVEQKLSQRAPSSMPKHVEDASPLASCRIDGPGKCLLTEMPAAPAASAVSAYTEEGLVSLWCLTKITSISRFSDANPQLVQIVGNALKPELPAVDATPALSSVCRHGEAADEDTEDGSDISDGVTMNSAAVPSFEERPQYLCPPTATVSEVEQASSNTDDELSEAVEPAAGHKCELEPSVHENVPRALSLQAAWSAQGDATSSSTPPEGYQILLEPASMYCCDKAIIQGCRRRGRPSAGGVEEDSEPLTRRTRRVAAELAAVTVTAAARNDLLDDDDSEEELDDVELEGEVTLSEEEDGEDEEYIARGGSGCGTKRNRHGPSPCGRNVRRLVSGSVCRECGIDKTPQWRIGPEGPRTLCNACGVRYKKVQKSQSRTKMLGRNRR